ncbi:MAG: SGNH/GDSL hydrolase family protein [Actinomycetota bacterium]
MRSVRTVSRPRRLAAVLGIVVASIAAAIGWSGPNAPTADALAVRIIEIDTPGPLGPLTVFGDSVMYGSAINSPTLIDHLRAEGWGPIRFVAGAGFNTGTPHRAPDAARLTWWIDHWRSEGWEPSKVVVNLGSNDSVFCPDIECMRSTITSVLDRLGPASRVWWPQMTLQPSRANEQFRWNTALAQVADAQPNLDTWDWPTEMRTGPYPSSDNIHLAPSGYRARSARMSQIITARLATGQQTGVPASLPNATGAPSRFVPLEQRRLADTRFDPPPTGGRRTTGDVLRVELGDAVPPGTTAVALHLAAVDTRAPGFLAAARCGRPTDASSVNFLANTVRGGPAITPVGDDGSVCVQVVGDAHVVVDLQGAFHPDHPDGLGFDPLPTPQRLHDTRNTGRRTEIRLTAPAGAEAVAINLTTVDQDAPGLLQAAPCRTEVEVAALNYLFDPVIAASAIAEVGDDGTFCVTSTSSVDVIVDLTGTFSDSGALRFVPVVPTRMLDTRNGTGGWGPLHGATQTYDVRVAPSEARAVTGTLTIVQPWWPAFLTGAPCGATASTSSVNALEFGFAANSLTAGITAGELCITASSSTHTLFDTTGWWID